MKRLLRWYYWAFGLKKRKSALESTLAPFKTRSKIGIFSMLLLSLFADKERIQSFLKLYMKGYGEVHITQS